MPKPRSVEDLSVDELRRLLVEKRRASRQGRLERFRRTGRVVELASDVGSPVLETIGTPGVVDTPAGQNYTRSRLRQVVDRFLLLIEIFAVLAFGYVVYSGVDVLRQLNRDFSTELQQPTLSPTPLILAVVLPGGHTPPDAQGRSEFNIAEIPEHLRPIYQSLADAPLPTPSVQQAVHIEIPAIDLGMTPIVQGDGKEQLKKGVGQHIGSANPGELGNVVLSAHNDIYGEIFRDLDKLQRGDLVILYTSQKAFTYVIGESPKVVEPTDVAVMAPTEDAVVTLISCYPYLVDNKRIIVRARLQGAGR
jgi:sortase A